MMLFTIFLFFSSVFTHQNINCKSNLKLTKCSKECAAFERGNLKDCTVNNSGVEIVLEEARKNISKILCKNCYFTARLISKLKENKKIHESSVITKGAVSINLLRDIEVGYHGVKINSSYFLISSSNVSSIFEKYKLLKLVPDELNGTFSLSGETIELPYDLEDGSIVYFGILKGVFLLYDIAGENYQEISVSIRNIKTYVKVAYYVFLSMGLIWIGLTMFRLRKEIMLRLTKKETVSK